MHKGTYTLGLTATLMSWPVYAADNSAIVSPVSLFIIIVLAVLLVVSLFGIYVLRRNLITERQRRIKLEKQSSKQVVTDSATGVLNRQGFLETLEYELRRAERHGTALCLLMFEVELDRTQGYTKTDQALATVAAVGRKTVRSIDSLGRIGDQTFIVTLPQTDQDGAQTLATRLQAALQECMLLAGDPPRIPITVSIGSAVHQPGDDMDSIMQRAEKALAGARHENIAKP